MKFRLLRHNVYFVSFLCFCVGMFIKTFNIIHGYDGIIHPTGLAGLGRDFVNYYTAARLSHS